MTRTETAVPGIEADVWVQAYAGAPDVKCTMFTGRWLTGQARARTAVPLASTISVSPVGWAAGRKGLIRLHSKSDKSLG